MPALSLLRSLTVLLLPLSLVACDASPPAPPRAPGRSPGASRALPAPLPDPSLALASTEADAAVLAPAPAPVVRPPGAYANIDPNDDEIVGPPDALPDCEGRLAEAGIVSRAGRLAVHTEHGTLLCGAPQVVTYLRGPGKIAYDPPPLLTCSMA